MSTRQDLEQLADLCNAAARAASEAIQRLGPRPAFPREAAEAWDANVERLSTQVDRLTTLASQFASIAVTQALEGAWPQLQQLQQAAATAEARIAEMHAISDAARKIAQVVNLGIAVLALAAAPGPATAAGVVQALQTVVA
jgi:DNA-binding protein YbaB